MRTIKKWAAFVLITVLFATVALSGCGSGEDEELIDADEPLVVLVAGEGGLGDNGFNDACWTGCEQAAEEFDVEIRCIEAKSGEMEAGIAEALQVEPDLIICAGSPFAEAVSAAAVSFPDQKFAIVDAGGLGDNVAGITFNEQEGSYLAGVAAALSTKANVVGLITGSTAQALERVRYGYTAGVITANPNAYLAWDCAETFSDTKKVKELAVAQHLLGADVIYQAAGSAGLAVIEAADDKGFWAIGADQDQSALAPEAVLCSMVKRADKAVYDVIAKLADDSFDGADKIYSLADGGVGISDYAGNLSEEVRETLGKYVEAIAKGGIVVPYDEASLAVYREQMASGAISAAVGAVAPGNAKKDNK